MSTVSDRVRALRAAMAERGVDAYLVPSADEHQSEYLPECWKRREWISGFTGSAGDVGLTAEGAGLWTDSRYFLQAEDELDGDTYTLFRLREPEVPTLEEWLTDTLEKGQLVGYDPRLLTLGQRERIQRRLSAREIRFEPVAENLVDLVRGEAPDLPAGEAFALPVDHAGETVESKLGRVRKKMAKSGATALPVTTLDAIAWLFNVRGTDIAFNPLVLSYASIETERAIWFVDEAKLTDEVRGGLADHVDVRPYGSFGEYLEGLGTTGSVPDGGARAWVDPSTASAWVADRLGDVPLVRLPSPVDALKCVKNDVELDGIDRAMVRDGVALVRFLRWLEERVPAGDVTELSAAGELARLRSEGEHFRGLSFETISGYAAHGAVVHYRVTEESSLPLESEGIYLVDSGAQYLDGTTDVTRTVALGPTTEEQRDRFTRVLRGHIELARLRFPKGSTGAQIELAARMPLWEVGLDYGHGTGHGVGHFLNVHEGPISISQRPSQIPLEPGMILSNEPGYYEAGAFGIRIENLVRIVEVPGLGTEQRPFLGLRSVTLCPIDRSLIDREQLSPAQVSWLDDYHRQVREALGPALEDPADRGWLDGATRPLHDPDPPGP